MKKNGDEILLMWVEKMLFPDVRKKHMACIFWHSKCLIYKNL